MTPEERERTIEFIIQSHARLAAAQEQDRQDRVEFEKWSSGLYQRVVDLIEAEAENRRIQTRRLDQYETDQREAQERHEEFLRETRERQEQFLRETRDRHDEVISWLRRILEKITDRMN
jgi:hypothetical protein